MSLSPGDRIDRYEVLELLGVGGMGEVYRARDPKLARLVALKILRIEGGEGTDATARLLREARASAALTHPNVVAIYDVGEVRTSESDHDVAYIAMELVDGRSLRACLSDPTLGAGQRLAMLGDVARALAAAHEVGIVHRDMKPENVMVRRDGTVKVLDFGIARRVMTIVERLATTAGHDIAAVAPTEEMVSTVTEQGKALGTPYYMAPEQLRGEAVDPRTDQFAWAVLAYELLTGAGPWRQNPNLSTTVSDILSLDPLPPIELQRAIPKHVSDTVVRALQKHPADRFPSMDALIVALQQAALETKSTTAPTERTSETALRPGRLWRWRFPSIALVLAGLTAGVTAFALWSRHARPLSTATTANLGCTNASCVKDHGGEPYLCRASDKTCVALASEDCTAMYEPNDLVAEDTVWLGAMFPTTGPNTSAMGRMNMAGTDFARKEIAEARDALRRSAPAIHLPPVALVGCDDGHDANRAARHLVLDINVPAILGFRSGREVIDIASSLLIPRHVVTVASLTATPQITALPQPPDLPRMVWRTTISADRKAEAAARFVEQTLEPLQATKRTRMRTRVTLVRPEGNITHLAMAEAFSRQLRFNNKSVVENADAYQELTFTLETTESPDGIATLPARIMSTAPTFLVVVGDVEFWGPLLEGVETASTVPRPIYVILSTSMKNLANFIGKSVGRRQRIFTIQSTENSVTNARFVIRYNDAFQDHVGREFNPSVSYDAFYLLAYATFAAGRDVTGPSIARAISRLVPPGPLVEVGPTGFDQAVTLLTSGSQIDLQGAATNLDFDLSTGEGPADFALVCSGVGPDGQASGEDVESGVVLRAHSTRVEGTMHCP